MGRELFSKVKRTNDLFVIMSTISMFLPLPVRPMFEPLPMKLMRAFSIPQIPFIAGSVLVWVLYDLALHVVDFARLPDFTVEVYGIILNKLPSANPCVFDPAFLSGMKDTFGQTCHEMSQIEADFSLLHAKAWRDLRAVKALQTLKCCDFAHEYELKSFRRSCKEGEEYFDATDSCVPEKRVLLAGDVGICKGAGIFSAVKLFIPPSFSLTWFDLWLQSGILGTFVILPAATNLVKSLLAYVDPLTLHGGRYEAPPASFYRRSPPGFSYQAQLRIECLLRAEAFRGCLIWGIISAVSLINMMWAYEWSLFDEPWWKPVPLFVSLVFCAGCGLGTMWRWQDMKQDLEGETKLRHGVTIELVFPILIRSNAREFESNEDPKELDGTQEQLIDTKTGV